MAKTKRVKPRPTAVMKDLADVDIGLKEIAVLKGRLSRIDAEFNEQVLELKHGRDQKVQELLARVEQLENGIFGYAEYNKDDLFSRRKSTALVYGIIGYRQSTRISVSRKTLAKLEDLGFRDAIIVSKKPNRDVMLQWPDDKLSSVGAKRIVEDKFWYELKAEELVERVAERKS